MKKEKISFLRLFSELENDVEILDELMEKYNLVNKKIKRISPDEFDWVYNPAHLGHQIRFYLDTQSGLTGHQIRLKLDT